MTARDVKRVPSMALAIVGHVALFHGVSVARVLGRADHKSMAHVRDEAAWLLLRAGYSTTVAGLALRRDHSSIIAARDRFDERLAMDPGLRERMAALTTRSAA